MRFDLKPHPQTPPRAITGVVAEASRRHDTVHGRQVETLDLSWWVAGDLTRLLLPPAAPAGRADELWKRTCFEAFVRPTPGEAYYEFNFSPSTEWAAYEFTGYREGMAAADMAPRPVETGVRGGCYRVWAGVEISRLPCAAAGAPWQIALTAVIEETDGRKSYWALEHPQGQPDFHHATGFALELPFSRRP